MGRSKRNVSEQEGSLTNSSSDRDQCDYIPRKERARTRNRVRDETELFKDLKILASSVLIPRNMRNQ